MPPVTKKPKVPAKYKVSIADYELYEALLNGKPHTPRTDGIHEYRPVSEDMLRSINLRIRHASSITGLGSKPKTPIRQLAPEAFTLYIAKKMAGVLAKSPNGIPTPLAIHDFETETRIFAAIIERVVSEINTGRKTINTVPTTKLQYKTSSSAIHEFDEEVYASIVRALHTLTLQHNPKNKYKILPEHALHDLRMRGLLRIGSLIELKEVREAVSKLVGIKPEIITEIVRTIESRNSVFLPKSLLALRMNEIEQNSEVLDTPIEPEAPKVHLVLEENDRKLIELDKIRYKLQVRHMQALAIYSVLAEVTHYHETIKDETLAENIARCYDETFMPQTALIVLAKTQQDIAIESANVTIGKSTPEIVAGLTVKFILEKYLLRSVTIAVEALLGIAKATEFIDQVEIGLDVSDKQIKALANILFKLSGTVEETLSAFNPADGTITADQTIIDTNRDWAVLDRYEAKINDNAYSREDIEAISYTYLIPLAVTKRILAGQFHGRKFVNEPEIIKPFEQTRLLRNIFGFSQIGSFDPLDKGFRPINTMDINWNFVAELVHVRIDEMLTRIEASQTTMISVIPPSSDKTKEGLEPGGSRFSMSSDIKMPPPIAIPVVGF